MQNDFPPKELQVEEWLKKAEEDLLLVEYLFREKGFPNQICFHSQQAAEKYLKAFLVLKKKWFPKIHPVDTLLELCQEIDPSFEEIKKYAVTLSAFYSPTRYPGDYPEFSWKDAEETFEASREIKEFVLLKIKP